MFFIHVILRFVESIGLQNQEAGKNSLSYLALYTVWRKTSIPKTHLAIPQKVYYNRQNGKNEEVRKMTGLGTIVNMAAILVGCAVGVLLKSGIPKAIQDTVTKAVGLCVLFIGLSGALAGMTFVEGSQLVTKDSMVMIFSMVAGSVLGQWADIERQLERLGTWCKDRIPKGLASGSFVEAFVSSSLLFCVGAMAVVGALEDGLNHNYSTLFAKAVMDGILALVFGASLGIGTAFSMFPVGIYQGTITVLAGLLRPYMTDLMIDRISFVGSILIFALGLNMVLNSKIKIGNMLPAIFMPVFVCLLGF